MQSVYEAAGGSDGLLRLAEAWHSRVMADEIVSHAFSHGFRPQHTVRLAAYGSVALTEEPKRRQDLVACISSGELTFRLLHPLYSSATGSRAR